MALLDTVQSVTRPNAMAVTEDLRKLTGLPKDLQIMFPGDIGKMRTPGSDLNSEEEGPRFASAKRLYIEVEEDFDAAAINGTSAYGQDYDPIFFDPQRRVLVRPLYGDALMTIRYVYKAPSKTEVTKWRDDIRMRLSQMRDLNLHSFKYHIVIPPTIFDIIFEIYNRCSKIEHNGENLGQYIHRCSDDRLTMISDSISKDYGLAISETQSRIQGMFGFDPLPEKPSREDQDGLWSIAFEYRLTYNKPMGLYMEHPIMIHNQLLPPRYTSYANSQYDTEKIPSRFSGSFKALRNFELNHINDKYADSSTVIRLPKFDDFLPERLLHGTVTVFFALSELDLSDRKTLLSLKDLGEARMDADILEFILKSEYPYIGKFYRSIIQINLYQHEQMAMSGSLSCDENGTVKSLEQLSVINNNRVRLSLVYDLSLLDKDALDRLRDYPQAFIKIIGALNGGLGWNLQYTSKDGGYGVSTEPLHPTYPYSKITNTDFVFAWILHNGGDFPMSPGNMPTYNDSFYNQTTNPSPNYQKWINDGLNGNNGPWRDWVLDYIRRREPNHGYPGNGGVGQHQPNPTPQPVLTDFGYITPEDVLKLKRDLPIMKTVERTCVVALRTDMY